MSREREKWVWQNDINILPKEIIGIRSIFFFSKMIDFHHFFGSKNWHKNKAIKVKYGMKRSEIKSCIEYHSHFIVLQF